MAARADQSTPASGSLAAPEDFHELPPSKGNRFLAHSGPIFGRFDGSEAVIGFRVEEHHCNAMGNCHGGMLLTFADTFLPLAVRLQDRVDDGFTPTVSMNADFMGPALCGDWVEGRGRLLKRTGRLLFTEGLIVAAGRPALRVSAIFKRGSPTGSERIEKLFALMNPA